MPASGSGTPIPDRLWHYYEAARGPFRNLSDLPLVEAEAVLERLRQEQTTFASKRARVPADAPGA